MSCEVAGLRPPHDGGVDRPVGDRIDNGRERMRLAVVPVHWIYDDVLPQSARGERVGGGRVIGIVTNNLHAESELPQPRIVERPQTQPAVCAPDEHVRGPIIWTRG